MAEDKPLTSFQLTKWKSFKDAMNGISKIFPDGILRFSDEGLRLRAMDQSNVLMVDFTMKKEKFTHCTLGEELKLKTNLAVLSQVLSKGKTDDVLTVTYSVPAEITFEGKKRSAFKIPNYDVSDAEAKRKPFAHKGFVCTFPISLVEEWLDAVDVTGESTLYLTITPEKILARAGCYHKGSDEKTKGWMEETLPDEKVLIQHVNSEVPSVECWLGCEHLKHMVKIMKIVDTCTVHFMKNHSPVTFEVREDGMDIDLILAPRVPQE